MSLFLKLEQVLLGDTCPSDKSQLGVVCKFTEGALDSIFRVTGKGIKLYWSQYGPLRDTNQEKKVNGKKSVHP